MQKFHSNTQFTCLSIPKFVALWYARSLSGKTTENAKIRVLVAMNGVFFTKSVSNKFKTMQKFYSNMQLNCYSNPEFVVLRYARSLSGKTIENAKKRVLVAVNVILFNKSVSNKFITVQNVHCSMYLYCYRNPEFVALRYARSLSGKTIENAKNRVFVAVNGILFSKMVSNKFITMANIFTNISLCCKAILKE